mgnify:CR=1 FL=1
MWQKQFRANLPCKQLQKSGITKSLGISNKMVSMVNPQNRRWTVKMIDDGVKILDHFNHCS